MAVVPAVVVHVVAVVHEDCRTCKVIYEMFHILNCGFEIK